MKLSLRCFIAIGFTALSFSTISLCDVSTTVRFKDSNIPLELADSNTPNIYKEIMEGTRLSITIDSNAAEYWEGLLLIEGDSQGLGGLYGRGYDTLYNSYKGSILNAAGDPNAAFVGDYFPSDPNGLQFFTAFLFDEPPVQAGEWFIVDYNAIQVGDCNITFYGQYPPEFIHNIQLKQVKTCDFDNSYKVNFNDFALLASYWDCNCTGPDWCEGTDLDDNNFVDINDLYLFSRHWLDITK